MRQYLQTDEWNIIEEGFHADLLRSSESIFSLGNGRFGQRGNFEEPYGSDCYPGSYVAGITYQDRTRVGWWKNGFPRYYTRIPNAANWSYVGLRLADEALDTARWDIHQFSRRLDMRGGISYRDMELSSPRGNRLRLHVEHIADMARPDLCLIRFAVTSVGYSGRLSLIPQIVGDNMNDTARPGEKVWNVLRLGTTNDCAYMWTQTRREDAQVCYAMTFHFLKNGRDVQPNPIRIEKETSTGFSLGVDVRPGDTVTLVKYVCIASSLYYERNDLVDQSMAAAREARHLGWDALVDEHRRAWQEIWDEADVRIEGDPEAQQGIRYTIFQLYQTYRGDDPRLNIGPKGFTGEKYGGNTYWNTELCCVPFFLLSTPRNITENLLLYRYRHLPQAIENARKLGFGDGAALFPQVTSSGEECHNEWEITFEEVHRNNIVAYAISQYTHMTGSLDYVARYGLEVMIAICRFWSQRVSFSQRRQQYVILGVTGPDEYENNVNNNWYTNFSTVQTLRATLHYLDRVAHERPDDYAALCAKTALRQPEETDRWRDIIERMYLPEDRERGIFVQDDGFLDKDLRTVDDIPQGERPINQHWSWDRILRSCYIKQSDVLLGLHLYYNLFDVDTIRRNFQFYDPMTVHESSLSPHIHAILAARTGQVELAYRLFLRATRMDLDDYNNEADLGLHITSMPGSWLAIAKGFAGVRLEENRLVFNPVLPAEWTAYTFRVNFLRSTLLVHVGGEVSVSLVRGEAVDVRIYEQDFALKTGQTATVTRKEQCSCRIPENPNLLQ